MLPLALLAAADIMIWRGWVRRKCRVVRRVYLVQIALPWLLLLWLVGFMIVRKEPWLDVERTMRMMLWVVWLFVLLAAGKIVYFIFWLTGRLLHRPKAWRAAGAAAGIALAAAMICGATRGRDHIEVRQVEIASGKLPASFDGARIAFFADLHLGNLMSQQRFLDSLVALTNGLQPDVVCFGGDMVNLSSDELTPSVVETLGRIRAKHGVFTVLGNHDLGIYGDSVAKPFALNVIEILNAYGRMGWTPLVNESVYISDGADSIAISGVGYPVSERHKEGMAGGIYDADPQVAYRGLPDSTFNITLSHTPVSWPEDLPCADLTLSGHTHSMQMKFTIFGASFSPARLRYKRWSGLYRDGERTLYINDGLGYVMFPMRIGTRPELTLITLRRR
jgi:predicted MPP superfamily phosphohydrolase